jgi:hypothetical protein
MTRRRDGLRWRCPTCGYREVEALYLAELVDEQGALHHEYRCEKGHLFSVRFDQIVVRPARQQVVPGAPPTP